MLLLPRQYKPAVAWAGIVLAGAVAGVTGYRAESDRLARDLLDNTRRAAAAFDPAEVRPLTGTEAGGPTPDAIGRRLQNLRAISADIRALELLRYVATPPQLTSLGRAAAPAPGIVTPARPALTPESFAALDAAVRNGTASYEGPSRDATGTWAVAYAPIAAGAGPAPAHDLLAYAVDASDWRPAAALAGARRALFVAMFLALPLFGWRLLRRQGEQNEVIRNLSEAMEQSRSALVIVDLAGRVEYANRGLCQQTGYSRRELLGRAVREFRAPELPDQQAADLVATLRSGRPWEGEWTSRRKDGATYPARGLVTPVKRRDGRTACYVALFDDVSESKRREAELRDARDLAEAGDRAKNQFLATMSHEVRTPLNGIVGFTSLLLDTELGADQRDYVQTIRASGEALIQLTSDILDFARIESGKMKLDPLACDPRESIEEALDLHAAKAAEKHIELLHRVDADVPAAIVTDGGRLRQILVNLVGNAVKFTAQGEVEVRVRCAPGSPSATGDTCRLEFSVRDTGIGIAAEQQDRLFKPFSQLDDSSTRRYGGTGLGLAICRNLVRLLGGEIHVASEPGRGATFGFTIVAPVAAGAPPPHQLAPLCVALVAGNPIHNELAGVVAHWGATVVPVEAIAGLAGQTWDVALVDVPEAVAGALAASAAQPNVDSAKCFGLVPISLSTELRHGLRAHFRLLVNKPVHHEALFGLLSGASPRAAQAPAPTHFGLRVLVVEDNAVNERLLRRVLDTLGCTHRAVENGRRALEELAQRAGDYDVVLLDFHMPEMDGIAALEEIRGGQAGPRAQTIWIIAVTADARTDQRARAVAAGINDYLTKPLKVPELEAAFRRFRSERLAAKR